MLMENAGIGGQESDPELGLLYRDISDFKDTEIPKAIGIIQAVARQINGELSAKRRSGGSGGKLDFRRTIRLGLETGSSFYRLRYKRKPTRRKQLVLLCDVSGSMVQFSEFALRFIQSLNQVSDSSRTFLFSETMVEADALQATEHGCCFRSFVKDSGIYGGAQIWALLLEQLCVWKPAVLGASTTLLICRHQDRWTSPGCGRPYGKPSGCAGRVIW